jgi:FMN phosphatase YigB (HAD superfamily)
MILEKATYHSGNIVLSSFEPISDLDLSILWVERTLHLIDRRYTPEFLRLKHSSVHRDIRRLMSRALIATYRQKRAPYVKLLADLQKQKRKSLADQPDPRPLASQA